jgi:hypothetical protein
LAVADVGDDEIKLARLLTWTSLPLACAACEQAGFDFFCALAAFQCFLGQKLIDLSLLLFSGIAMPPVKSPASSALATRWLD